jgi:hypothetical protein
MKHIQIAVNVFWKQDIVYMLKDFNNQEYATKIDMLSKVLNVCKSNIRRFEVWCMCIFKSILSHTIFDGKLVTQNDYTGM